MADEKDVVEDVVTDDVVVDPPVNDEPAVDAPDPTLLDSAGAEDEAEPVVPADFPEDWRERMAGEDTKFLGILKRYASPVTFGNAYKSLRQRQDSGELKAPLPENADDKQIAAYRKENGIPDVPAGYDLEGVNVAEEDQPAVDEYLKSMHEQNATPDQVKGSLETYFKLKADAEASVAERDSRLKQETEDSLRAEYGADYRRNMMGAFGFLDSMPEGLKDNLMGARLADGTLFGDNANSLRWLVQTARELNPAATIVPGMPDDSLKSIGERREEIRKLRREKPNEYQRDSALQEEERRLIDAEAKLKERAAA